MKKWHRVLIGVLATVGALYIALMLFVSFGIKPEKSCTVYPVMVLASPDGKFSAEQRQEICNDESQVITTVWLSKGGSVNLGGRKWSVFRAPSAQAVAREPVSYEPLRLQLAWLSNSELQISYARGTGLRQSESNEHGVTVRFREITEY